MGLYISRCWQTVLSNKRQTMQLDSSSSSRGSRAAWAILGLLLAINLLNFVDRYVLAAVEVRIQHDMFPDGYANVEFWMGLLPTAFLASYMLAAPFFGWLADRVNRWWIIAGGVIVWSLASGASGLATSYGMLLATRLFVGIGEAAYGPAAPTVISDLFPVEKRGRVLSLFYLAIPVGSPRWDMCWVARWPIVGDGAMLFMCRCRLA